MFHVKLISSLLIKKMFHVKHCRAVAQQVVFISVFYAFCVGCLVLWFKANNFKQLDTRKNCLFLLAIELY